MHAPPQPTAAFKRQIVFRVGSDDWQLLEAAAREHGSLQAALIAAIRTLAATAPQPPAPPATPEPTTPDPPQATTAAPPVAAFAASHDEELTARQAATLLGLKASTIRGYIRSGRLPGRYEGEPGWRGWLTTRTAVTAYRNR